MKKVFIILFLAIGVLGCDEEENNLPKILVIGDSISIGYTPYVSDDLLGKANVHHQKGNAQHTGTGLENIEEWIGNGKWDIVQFNWGLWDLCYNSTGLLNQKKKDKVNGEVTFTIDDYAANLDSLVTIIKSKTNAKLVFVTTTYVPENEPGRFVGDDIKYNEAAKIVMEKQNVSVNDIYASSVLIHKEYGEAPNNVHYTDIGYSKLGKMITRFLEKELDEGLETK